MLGESGGYMGIYSFKIHFILLSIFLLTSCSTGSVIITGNKRQAISYKEVTLYAEAPKKYEVIGIVKASSDSGWTKQGKQDYAIKELRKQAANIGANGVLITESGEKDISSEHTYTLTGRAIYIAK